MILSAVLAAAIAAAPAWAFRIVPGSLRAEPAALELTRTLTVTVELEDERRQGAQEMEVLLDPVPPLVRLLSSSPPLPFTCSSTGSSRGTWTYEALAPGKVTFALRAAAVSCTLSETTRLEAVAGPVALLPLPVWSGLALAPRHLGPGQMLELALTLRNDSASPVVVDPPRADPDWLGHERAPAERAGEPGVDPLEALRAGRLVLGPGEPVRVTWRFRALEPGRLVFVISGAGLLMRSPVAVVRPAPALEVALGSADAAASVGRRLAVRGAVRARGGAGVTGLTLTPTWSPAGAARLADPPVVPDAIEADGPPAAFRFALEPLAPGPLRIGAEAGGREADTGRAVPAAVAAPREARLLPPPELRVTISVSGGPVFVGERKAIVIRVSNGGEAAATSMTPLCLVRSGAAEFPPVTPMFQTVAPGAETEFRGGVIPRGEGAVVFTAQVTARAAVGGDWVTAVSAPAEVGAIALPRLEVHAVPAQVKGGEPGRAALVLRNASPRALTVTALALTGFAGDLPSPVVRPPRLPLTLAPGAGATVAVEVSVPPGTRSSWLEASLNTTVAVADTGLTASLSSGLRPVAMVRPDGSQVLWAEPSVFAPPLDPVLGVAWSLSSAGRSGVVVATAAGAVVRVLASLERRNEGVHEAFWDGRSPGGAAAAAGAYVVRLAGPPPAGGAWPQDASWTADRPFELKAP